MYTCRSGLGRVRCSVCGSAAKGRTIRDRRRGSCVRRMEKERKGVRGRWIWRGDSEKDRDRESISEGEREKVMRGERVERGERDCTPSSWQPMVVWLAAALVRGERAHTKYRARPMREK